jgi:hypothetical protein
VIVEFYPTEDRALARCREINRGLSPSDPCCAVVIDGPESNFAVVDQETMREILDDSGSPYLIVTD